jgi:plastocyanin
MSLSYPHSSLVTRHLSPVTNRACWDWIKRTGFLLALLLGIALPALGGTLQGTVRCPEAAVVYAVPEKTAPLAPPREPAVIEQRDLRFHPPVLPVLQGTRVLFPNYDPLYHNVFSVSPARPFNLGMFGPNEARGIVFDRPGIVEVRCMVHREMVAYVVVLTTPHFQMSDPTGAFAFRDLPEGRYRVHAWSPRCGALESPWIHVPRDQTVQVELRPPLKVRDEGRGTSNE